MRPEPSPPPADPPSAQRRRWVLGLPLTVLAGPLALGACALDPDRDHTGDDAPQAVPLPRQPRTAWVFSSGGPRGFVHVGVLKALQELGVAPDLVVGASAGALLGVLCAAGLSGRELDVLRGLLQGKNPKTIAAELGITDKTLYAHRTSIMHKTGARSIPELQERVLMLGLI